MELLLASTFWNNVCRWIYLSCFNNKLKYIDFRKHPPESCFLPKKMTNKNILIQNTCQKNGVTNNTSCFEKTMFV